MSDDRENKLVVLLSIDGWGLSLNTENNAIRKAQIDGFKNLVMAYPATVITMPNLKISQNYKLLGSSLEIDQIDNTANLSLSKIISEAGLKQLKMATSQDFPLASVFFNNSSEPFNNEDWLIINEKKNKFLSFFQRGGLEDNLIKQINSGNYNFIFSIFSDISQKVFKGDFLETISVLERVSESLEKISQVVLEKDGVLIITSTYGGAEDVFNIGTGLANKKKTDNAVPFLIIGNEYKGKTIGLAEAPNNDISLLSPQGTYLNILPTILKILDLPIPDEILGESFI